MIMNLKLGRRPAKRLLKTPALGDYLTAAKSWPAVAPWGWEASPDLGPLDMLANDTLGDCGPAGAMHLIQVQTANTGNPLHGTVQQTIDLYSAVTGYNPADQSTDQGTVLTDLLAYWKTTGIAVTDATGKEVVHKILGWASLDLSSIAQQRYATYLFGGTYLGINCPQSALQDTDDWQYVPGSPIEGGHCICGVGQGGAGGKIVSWGKVIPYAWPFMQNALEEAYIVISEDWIESQSGKSPSGLDLSGLTAAMAAL